MFRVLVVANQSTKLLPSNPPPNKDAILGGPPPSYDYRRQLGPKSIEIISQRYPQLLDLASAGAVLAIPRPSNYVERRTDGYCEPELVILVGTAHLSNQSADDVRRVIAAVRPENVVVELCKSRCAQLYDDVATAGATAGRTGNALSLRGDSLLEAYTRSLSLGGRSALLLRLFLGALSTNVGVDSGVEFRAARKAADAVEAQIVLGDRPIEVTLRRAWDAMPVKSRWVFTKDLVLGAQSAKGAGAAAVEAAVERLKQDDAMSSMLSSFAERFPEAMAPLVHERDMYLAWSLKRSKAVNGSSVVVGVVGRGHMRGVCYAITHDSSHLRFRDLAGSRKKEGSGPVEMARNVAIETGIMTALWWCWSRFLDHGT